MNHRYSTVALISILLLFGIAGIGSAKVISKELDNICDKGGSVLFKPNATSKWQCGNLTDAEINLTINNVTNVYNNRSIYWGFYHFDNFTQLLAGSIGNFIPLNNATLTTGFINNTEDINSTGVICDKNGCIGFNNTGTSGNIPSIINKTITINSSDLNMSSETDYADIWMGLGSIHLNSSGSITANDGATERHSYGTELVHRSQPASNFWLTTGVVGSDFYNIDYEGRHVWDDGSGTKNTQLSYHDSSKREMKFSDNLTVGDTLNTSNIITPSGAAARPNLLTIEGTINLSGNYCLQSGGCLAEILNDTDDFNGSLDGDFTINGSLYVNDGIVKFIKFGNPLVNTQVTTSHTEDNMEIGNVFQDGIKFLRLVNSDNSNFTKYYDGGTIGFQSVQYLAGFNNNISMMSGFNAQLENYQRNNMTNYIDFMSSGCLDFVSLDIKNCTGFYSNSHFAPKSVNVYGAYFEEQIWGVEKNIEAFFEKGGGVFFRDDNINITSPDVDELQLKAPTIILNATEIKGLDSVGLWTNKSGQAFYDGDVNISNNTLFIGPEKASYGFDCNPDIDRLCVHNERSGAGLGRTALFTNKVNNTANSAFPYGAFNAFTIYNGTGSLTRTAQQGAIFAGRYGILHQGSGQINTAHGVSSFCANVLLDSTPTILECSDFYAEGSYPASATVKILSNYYASAGNAGGGTVTNRTGYYVEEMTTGDVNNFEWFIQKGGIYFQEALTYIISDKKGQIIISANETNITGEIVMNETRTRMFNHSLCVYDKKHSLWVTTYEQSHDFGNQGAGATVFRTAGRPDLSANFGWHSIKNRTITGLEISAPANTPAVTVRVLSNSTTLTDQVWNTPEFSNRTMNVLMAGNEILAVTMPSITTAPDYPRGTIYYREVC